MICTSLLIFQIYLSWKTFIQEDYIETKSKEKLYNVDLPMIMICAKNPFIDRTDLIGWDDDGKFVGWAKENTSVQEILRSNIRVNNSTDLVNSAYTSDDLIKNNESISLRFERLRIMPFNGQCFAVAVPKDDVKRKIKKSSTFSVTLEVKNDSGVQVYLLDPNVYNGYYSPRKALKFHHYQVFDVALAQKEQSPYDPSANCEMYDSLRGYYQCVTDAAEKNFLEIIGCVPPWFSDNYDIICQNEDIKTANSKLQENRYSYGKNIAGR